jgi:sodium-dependent phosphate cotransporter
MTSRPNRDGTARTAAEKRDSTAVAVVPSVSRTSAWAQRLGRLILFVVSLALFVVALELMKSGAGGAATLLERYLDIDNVPNALGFGWFATYLVLSGSPVAAVSVAFLATGALQQLPAYAMITGSRLGASFIVLFIGFVYVLRGQERRTGLAMGLLALVVTAAVYLPALVIGILLLEYGLLDAVQLSQGAALGSILDRALQPISQWLSSFLPGWAVMLAGLGVLWVSFYLFDRVLPELDLEHSRFGRAAHLVYRPLVMFLLGGVLTLLTLSVSLSLSLLVPLSARGYVRRENAIPYIMGANITTFVDTLLATVVLGSSDAFTVVLANMLSVTVLSLLILILFSNHYQRAVLGLVKWTLASNRNLALFIFTILVVPLVLMLI